MKEELREWASKVSQSKKNLDKRMFDDLVKNVLFRLNKNGYEDTFKWLNDNYEKGINHQRVGPYLLATNSKQVKDKLWSLNK
jgi:hypothetical protein